jgi:hypothetical protein
MIMLQKPSFGAPVAIAYITVGALIDVWSGIWYFYLRNNPPQDNTSFYFCTGFFLTGLVLIVIGLALGPIGRVARQAEHHPELVPEEPKITMPATAVPTVPVGNGSGSAQGLPAQGVSSQGPVTVTAAGGAGGQALRPDNH